LGAEWDLSLEVWGKFHSSAPFLAYCVIFATSFYLDASQLDAYFYFGATIIYIPV